MNDTLADAVLLEYARYEAQLRCTGWQLQPHSATTARLRFARLLMVLAAWLAPTTSPGAAAAAAPASS
jgi:hypothetical protein